MVGYTEKYNYFDNQLVSNYNSYTYLSGRVSEIQLKAHKADILIIFVLLSVGFCLLPFGISAVL